MRKSYTQMSLLDTYDDVNNALVEHKHSFLQMLDEHIDFSKYIQIEFHIAFNRRMGRPRGYTIENFIRFFVLQKTLGIQHDSSLLSVLRMSQELRDFCGFVKVPAASLITRFKQDFVHYIKGVFDNLVEITEPICREMSPKKSDYLIYDTTGIEPYVAENNPKFQHGKLKQAKKLAKSCQGINPYIYAYKLLPESAKSNPFVKQQYINGHYSYAHKAGILVNGLGIVRDISFFDESFRRRHPEAVHKKSDDPGLDKEIGDSTSLKPVLSDFFKVHKSFSYGTFLADAAFDTYDNYTMLHDEFHFNRVAVPLNKRNTSSAHKDFTDDGTPLCPVDKTPFTYLNPCRGKNRSMRFKWVCHKSHPVHGSSKRLCVCDTPCTTSSYGRCVYTYPHKNFRLYPGIPRGTEHWDNLYRHRVLAERTINLLKDPLGAAGNKSFSTRSAKADLLFAGITHLVGVVIAHAINKQHLCKSIRKLIA